MDERAKINEVTAFLTRASEAWKTPSNESARVAMEACEQALRILDGLKHSPDTARLKAAAWMQRGQVLDTANQPLEAVRCYEQAIAVLPDDDVADAQGLAAVHMNRGNALLRSGGADALQKAGESFAGVIAQLGRLPEPRPPELENIMGGAWMSLGTCQARSNETDKALGSFDQSIGILMRTAEKISVARRNLGAAWGNRGVFMLQTQQWSEAQRCFREAMGALEALEEAGNGSVPFAELANLRLQLAQALAADNEVKAAVETTRAVLESSQANASTDPHVCDVNLRARHALCVLLAGQLSLLPRDSEAARAHVSEAGDLAEEGLAIAKNWGGQSGWFADQSLRLFEFGAWLYRTQQPQFLAEYVEENLTDSDPRRAKIAAVALRSAAEALRQRSFAELGPDALEWLQSWETLRTRLEQPPVD